MKLFLPSAFLYLFIINFSAADINAANTASLRFKKSGNIYTGTSFEPDFFFITVKLRPQESGKNHNWEHYYVNQKIKQGYRIAQLIGWQKNNHWGFETGVALSRKVMMVDFPGSRTIPEVSEINNNASLAYYHTFFNTIDLPFRAVFTAGKGRVKFFSYAGINQTICYNIYQEEIGFENNITVSKALITKNLDYKKIFSSSDWGAGIKIKLNNKAQLRLNAAVQRSYSSIKASNKKVLLWSNGLSVGYIHTW
jgi:hypothetical protein